MSNENRFTRLLHFIRPIFLMELGIAVISAVICLLIGWKTVPLFGGMFAFVGIFVGMIFYFINQDVRTGRTPTRNGVYNIQAREQLLGSEYMQHKTSDDEKYWQIGLIVMLSLLIGWAMQGL